MADAIKMLEGKIKTLRSLEFVNEQASSEVAEIIRGELAKQVAEGRAPDGELWDRRADGKQALASAMDGIRMTSLKNVVTARITKRHLVLHHYGYARGNVKRPILPPTITPEMEQKIRDHFAKKFDALMEEE